MRRWGVIAALAAFALDRAVKCWLLYVYGMPAFGLIKITPFFDLVMAWNRGVSFGLLFSNAPAARWLLIAMTGAIALGLAVWLWKCRSGLVAVALGLVIGGALGNIYDRVVFGAVADFFQLHVAQFYWPAFNVADSVITIGVFLLVWDALFASRPSPDRPPPEDRPQGAGKDDHG